MCTTLLLFRTSALKKIIQKNNSNFACKVKLLPVDFAFQPSAKSCSINIKIILAEVILKLWNFDLSCFTWIWSYFGQVKTSLTSKPTESLSNQSHVWGNQRNHAQFTSVVETKILNLLKSNLNDNHAVMCSIFIIQQCASHSDDYPISG